MSEHTPEPWTTHQPTNPYTLEAALDVGIAAQVGDTPKIIAEAFGQVAQTVFTPAAANALRIVACVNPCKSINPEAVPDLLAACESAVVWLERPTINPDEILPCGINGRTLIGVLMQVRAAIAKAREDGKQ